MEDQNKYDLFDRYIRGELAETELDEFLERLESDSEFKEDFSSYQLVVEGIREHERQELKAYMQQKARVRFMGNPWSRSWTYASAAVILAFSILYLVVDNNSSLNEYVAAKDTLDTLNNSDTSAQIDGKEEQLAMEDPAAPREQAAVDSMEATEVAELIAETTEVFEDQEAPEEMDYPDPLANDSKVRMDQEDELPVKADTRVHDTVLSLALSFEKAGKPDTAQSAVLKKKELAVRNEKIVVQFWKSPINYKGYRFDGRKLEAFGLDTFSQVSLKYRVVNAELKVYEIYLKYGDAYFKLEEDNRYHSYIRVKDPAIIEELK